MKIYIASSWKNEKECITLANLLRLDGHEVDCFCDKNSGRLFNFNDLPDITGRNGITILDEPIVQKAFTEDKKWIDWAEAVVLLLPCGKSAHLEAGYAKGRNKQLFILGEFPKGEFDVMYGFADGLFRSSEFLRYKLQGVVKR